MNGKAPVNRPAIRREIRVLERQLSEATCSSDRAPLLDQLEAKQAELRRFYAHVRTLPRFDANGTPLPRFGVHAPLEPDNNLHSRTKRVGPASDERSRRHATAAATGEVAAQSTGPHGRSAAASPPSPNERKTR